MSEQRRKVHVAAIERNGASVIGSKVVLSDGAELSGVTCVRMEGDAKSDGHAVWRLTLDISPAADFVIEAK